jgi:exopolysaccharide production protein ExoY
MKLVHGPHVPLPPFGRRADDIRPLHNSHLVVRRALDIVVATFALMIAAPAMLILAISIKCTSRGPAFFRHTRIGLGGQSFEMIKFRSMRVGTHQAVWSTEEERLEFMCNDFKLSSSDRRITRIGRVLRHTSLDELPQFINVLKGDMSIVGVRPLVATELSMRPEIDQALYCRLRPGITGLWQTSGRSSVVHNERIAMDRAYAAVWHPMWDVEILLKTPKSLLRTDHAA